jgi:hypothetical protein
MLNHEFYVFSGLKKLTLKCQKLTTFNMQSDSNKTEWSLQSSAKKIQSNGQPFNSRSFAEYIGHLILALLKVKQYSSNGKRVNYWKGSGCDPQNLAGSKKKN